MLRIAIIITLLLMAIPLFNSCKDYVTEKAEKAEAAGKEAAESIKKKIK